MMLKIFHIKKGTSGNSFLFFFLLVFILSGFTSCNFPKEEEKMVSESNKDKSSFPYDLLNPDTIYRLPPYLEEISGISWFKSNNIACVQDEHATIYIFNTKKGKVTSKIDFGKNGDYEDIAVVGKDAYVLRSDGTLFKVENFEESKKIKADKIKTALSNKNDTEGLVFDKKTNSLLIACKASSSIDKKELYNGFKTIYRFNLKNKRLFEKPAYLIDLSITDSLKGRGRLENFSIKTAKKLNLIEDDSSFHPSGIAIHPFNNNIYILSSVEKLLIIMDKNGRIINIIKLDNQLFNQPEGISFSETGDLFISNEKKHNGGNILKFRYIENI